MITFALQAGLLLLGIFFFGFGLYIWVPGLQAFLPGTTTTQSQQVQQSTPTQQTIRYDNLASRPLFQRDRRFQVSEPEVIEEPVDEGPFIPEVPLVKGVAIIEKSKKIALIQSAEDGTVYRLEEGDYLDDKWFVSEINFFEILMVDDDGNEISLAVR